MDRCNVPIHAVILSGIIVKYGHISLKHETTCLLKRLIEFEIFSSFFEQDVSFVLNWETT